MWLEAAGDQTERLLKLLEIENHREYSKKLPVSGQNAFSVKIDKNGTGTSKNDGKTDRNEANESKEAIERKESRKNLRPPKCVLLSTKNYILDSITMKMSSDLSQFEAPTSNVGDKEADLVAKIFENSNLSLRMYGSSEELAGNVKIYRSSPGSGLYADANGHPMYPYYTTPVIYRSLKDEQYLCKSDAYIILQNLTLEVYPFEKPQLLRVILALFLRSQELKNLKRVEFLKFDEKDFASIKKEIENEMKAFGTDPSEFFPMMTEITNLEFPDLYLRFKSLIKIDWGDSEAALFERILGNYFLEFCMTPNFGYLLTILYSTTEKIIKLLQKIIDDRLEMFSLGGPRPTVRLFEDHGGQQFVMEAELFIAINKSMKAKNGFDQLFIEAMTMEDVQKKFGEQIKDIEFIRYPIHRAKDRAVPIQSPLNNKLFCVPTVDAFFDFMKNLILSVQLFQKLPSWDRAEEMLLGCELGFKPEERNPYFTMSTHLNTVKATYLATPLPHAAKEIRNAKKDGFTIQNLKNELAHLGLTTIFPEIQNHAEVVYSEVDKRKKGSVLRTCDLFDAIEHCQLNCILERRPTFKRFLHNQKGCHRVYGFKCQKCEVEQKASEIQKAFEPACAATEDTKSPEAEKSNEQSSTVSQKPPEALQKTFEDLEITKETSEDVKTSESQKKSPEAFPPIQKLPEPTVTQKESKNCEKCFRTCEILNETRKELKSNENKIMNMEKKVSAKEKKLEEKEEEIQKKSVEIEELKRKVEENMKIAEESKKLISESTQLTDYIARFKEENLRQTEKFLGQISHLENELDMAKQSSKVLNQKVLELENQKAENENWQAEKQNLHLEIQENARKMKEFHEENIRMKTENEVKQQMIQQLLDKLASSTSPGNSYSNPPSNYRRPESPSLGPNSSNPRPSATSTTDAPNNSNPESTCSGSNYSNPEISKC
ncbi:hypothetical protein B9Z55_005122 [Caenorhabditis nigoni]|uniref:DUF7809 domain-containing protein n=1 Tax=Caenorhabditis nigoni TaxID=1611254 RepID=A0A2G5UZV2_9PELO|nr:hypothetical protein B9Z55_005122 [Caenorhabditis nigoni]